LTIPIFIEDDRGIRRVQANEFPLAVGGPESDIRLPGIRAPEPVVYLALSEGEIFAQPGDTDLRVLCNGTLLTASQWLRDGDVIRIGRAQILVGLGAERIRFRVEEKVVENKTDPPLVVAPKRPQSEERSGPAIKPVAFEPSRIWTSRRTRRTVGLAEMLLWSSLALLGAVAWFVFTARSILIEVEPTLAEVSFEGSPLVFELGGRYLLRPGRYTVTVEKDGYRPIEAPVEVTRNRDQTFRFTLEKTPGFLTISTAPVEGAVVSIDGEQVGMTPLDGVELSPGEHEVLIRAESYADFSAQVTIEGSGSTDTLRAELDPRWAAITFATEPPGATVRVSGRRVGATPVTARLMEGAHAYEFGLPGHKSYRGRLVVVAGEPQNLEPVRLALLDGKVMLQSNPPGANVTVNGVYRGETPLDLHLDPGELHEITVARAGYQPQSRQLQIESANQQVLTVELVPILGDLEIVSDPPDAQIYVNGELRGAANQVLRLVAVPQKIEIRKVGYQPFGTTVTPRPGFPQSIEVTLKTMEEAKAEATPSVIKTSQGHELRLIRPLRFQMGASRREPGRRSNETLREVELTRPFYIATNEVTNRQFREFKQRHRSRMVGGINLNGDDQPVVRVTWQDAARYCNWLSAQESLPPAYVENDGKLVATSPLTTGYRLPTEAEWVRVARYPDGDSALKYPWGSSLPVEPNSGNYADASARELVPTILPNYNDSFPVTATVDSFEPNPLGLVNLGGNVAEWIHDFYTIYPSSQSELARDPLGPKEGELHVIKGSSWMNGSVTQLRLSYRDYGNTARPDLGFRIARYAE
jgi:formylglycine-generating enzyme required for sulfatase activity